MEPPEGLVRWKREVRTDTGLAAHGKFKRPQPNDIHGGFVGSI